MTADTSITAPLLAETTATNGVAEGRRPAGLTITTSCDGYAKPAAMTPVRSGSGMTPVRSGSGFIDEVLAIGASPLVSPNPNKSFPSPTGSSPGRRSSRISLGSVGSGVLSPAGACSPMSPGSARRNSTLSLVAADAVEGSAFASHDRGEVPLSEGLSAFTPNFGVGLVLANVATLAFSLQMLCVKLGAGDGLPSMQLLLVRLGIHTFAVLVCCGLGSWGYHGRFWQFETRRSAWLTAAIGIFNMIVIQLLYYATTQLSLALATVIYFTSPIWSGIWKTLLLHDEYSYADGAFSLLSVIAVCIVTLPHEEGGVSDGGVSVAGSMAALLSGALQALAYVLVQVLRRAEEDDMVPAGKRVHWLQINMSNAVFGAVLCPLALWGPFKFQDPMDLTVLPLQSQVILCGVGVFTVMAQFTLVQSQAHLDACLVTVIRTLDVGYATFYQSVFISHIPPIITDVVGVVLLVVSCAGSAWHSRWVALRLAGMDFDETDEEDTPTRK